MAVEIKDIYSGTRIYNYSHERLETSTWPVRCNADLKNIRFTHTANEITMIVVKRYTPYQSQLFKKWPRILEH